MDGGATEATVMVRGGQSLDEGTLSEWLEDRFKGKRQRCVLAAKARCVSVWHQYTTGRRGGRYGSVRQQGG